MQLGFGSNSMVEFETKTPQKIRLAYLGSSSQHLLNFRRKSQRPIVSHKLVMIWELAIETQFITSCFVQIARIISSGTHRRPTVQTTLSGCYLFFSCTAYNRGFFCEPKNLQQSQLVSKIEKLLYYILLKWIFLLLLFIQEIRKN